MDNYLISRKAISSNRLLYFAKIVATIMANIKLKSFTVILCMSNVTDINNIEELHI